MMDSKKERLIQKYNSPVPRYTSYPTVPFWENQLDLDSWEELVKKAFHMYGEEEGITLYIHFPFCESLCTYCGCNKYITKNHSIETPYIKAVKKEWKSYLTRFGSKPLLKGIHLGGGTPTFFSPESLHSLLNEIISDCYVDGNREFSFEGHPNNTTEEHLATLHSLGFDRVSFGIQDFDLKVQQAIHRVQPFETVVQITEAARRIGYTSINFDLIYGLPHQNKETLSQTFGKVMDLKPERIAFYSYAHLPSLFKAQKSFEQFLPNENDKRALYELGKDILTKSGYEEVGMDHFALPEDPLCKAKSEGSLHRNFMGYTTSPSKLMIGLGATSISDIHLGFAQNEKGHKEYIRKINEGSDYLVRSHENSASDLIAKEFILDLICHQEARIDSEIWNRLPELNRRKLAEMQEEELISIKDQIIKVSDFGMTFIRNICFQFDLKMLEAPQAKSTFSKSI
ncbi:oxygen-independent coproporphyrinogen III oxidase [Algoriphagus sediminis]|uniref:Coproporphyrinogen-III oxidase n=1 Tax=Algoriphagus sediminis TaxID=3057113 RepID=A0ABT7Y9H9_9BACT|nr:oxygen-independent coproporphyrinogen III oxidase [Algoriphagus sediminis]MDN3203154.1 oxygen-independent coproporphyrinogen III oxidase [Algoriphagus sediminis]